MPGRKKKQKEEYDQKTAKLTPEEQEMRRENLEARERINDDGLRRLCAAVCLNAVGDYTKTKRKLENCKAALRGKNARYIPKKTKEAMETYEEDLAEMKEFFESEMFTGIVGMHSAEETIRRISTAPRFYMGIPERRNA